MTCEYRITEFYCVVSESKFLWGKWSFTSDSKWSYLIKVDAVSFSGILFSLWNFGFDFIFGKICLIGYFFSFVSVFSGMIGQNWVYCLRVTMWGYSDMGCY